MSNIMKKRCDGNEDGAEQRKGPWTLEEDTLLTNYIANNGEGRWNLLAKSSGLKRKGKSCRLRWLNYLKPNVKRGNLTLQEQLLILELHSKWGNRWSKIAQYLPGRTDNEIKNYWRTRVQKQARMLNIDSNSHKFLEVVRGFLVPRLIHKKMIEDNNTKPPLPPYDDFRGPVSRDKYFSQETVFNYIDSSTTSMSQELKKTPQSMDLSHHLLETIDSSMHLGGSRGSRSSSSKCVSEESYNSFPCLDETTMGNSVISPFQEFHVAGSVYEEDVTQDPMWWNMDDIWQFNECEHF